MTAKEKLEIKMSRSGYVEDYDGDQQWDMIRYRGAVKSAINGKRGQEFLRDMVEALDALPKKELIANDLVTEDGCCCAMGAVALYRGLDVSNLDPYDRESVACHMGIATAMANEISFENDENGFFGYKDNHSRWKAMRAWAKRNLK